MERTHVRTGSGRKNAYSQAGQRTDLSSLAARANCAAVGRWRPKKTQTSK
jgi:hypothetical protein